MFSKHLLIIIICFIINLVITLLTIKKNITNEIIINKSRFITCLIKINNEAEIVSILNKLKLDYPGATHYCYAYIIDNVKRFNDDGEPGGTAGMPILNVLENNNINRVLCVVIRYFGGTKLGAGGLVRAYSNSASQALNLVDFVKLVSGYEIQIKFNYNVSKDIEHLLRDVKIISKEFSKDIVFQFLISSDEYENIQNNLKSLVKKLVINESLIIEQSIK